MLTMSVRKILAALLTLLVSSFLIFAALRLVPGDPVLALTAGRRLTPEQIEAVRGEYGLDQPFLSSYLSWLSGSLRLDFGDSLAFRVPVWDVIESRLGVSAMLIAYSATLAIGFGFSLSLLGAARGGAADQAVVYSSSVASATPAFVSAIVLVSVFAVRLGWFPALGAGEGFADRLHHLTLPAIALAFSSYGILARLSRSNFLEQLNLEHVEVARSRGVSSRAVLRRHVVRNSLGPLLTLVALLLSTLFVGTAVVETAFGIDGVGSLLVESVGRRDLPVVQAIALCSVTLFVVSSTLVDLILPKIDPRLRPGASA